MKLHLIFSLLMISGLAMAQVTADGNSPTEGSGSSSSVGSTGTGEERAPGDDGGFSDGEDVVISRPGPEPAPETSPEEEELIAYRAELAERVEAGELTWDEAQELYEELALSLGLGRNPDDVIDIDIDEIDERERLLEDFIEELDSQVQSGALSPDEAEASEGDGAQPEKKESGLVTQAKDVGSKIGDVAYDVSKAVIGRPLGAAARGIKSGISGIKSFFGGGEKPDPNEPTPEEWEEIFLEQSIYFKIDYWFNI